MKKKTNTNVVCTSVFDKTSPSICSLNSLHCFLIIDPVSIFIYFVAMMKHIEIFLEKDD